ncbi:hypothetical protein [Bacillus sp. NP247]|nr:hypothetical protein [Bacillus sp. NP247]
MKIVKALAEVKRIEIVRYLFHNKNKHTCREIETTLEMSLIDRIISKYC